MWSQICSHLIANVLPFACKCSWMCLQMWLHAKAWLRQPYGSQVPQPKCEVLKEKRQGWKKIETNWTKPLWQWFTDSCPVLLSMSKAEVISCKKTSLKLDLPQMSIRFFHFEWKGVLGSTWKLVNSSTLKFAAKKDGTSMPWQGSS